MKHVTLTYLDGTEEAFPTTNANAASMVDRFCNGGQLLVEQFECHFEVETVWFERAECKSVSADDIDQIEVVRVDAFDDDGTTSIRVSEPAAEEVGKSEENKADTASPKEYDLRAASLYFGRLLT
ncbi:hypothetical protein [Glycomyces tarimensis]